MMVVGIQERQKEPIHVLVIDMNGIPLSGKTDIKIRIQRHSDLNYYDWSDNTFKATPTRLLETLQEVSAVRSPGEYYLNTLTHVNGFDTNLITNPNSSDIYFVTAIQDGGTDAGNLPQFGEIRVGTFVVANKAPTFI